MLVFQEWQKEATQEQHIVTVIASAAVPEQIIILPFAHIIALLKLHAKVLHAVIGLVAIVPA
jgi:hypothetical protein